MKILVSAFIIAFSPLTHAKDTSLADYCGRLAFAESVVTVTLPGEGRIYRVESGPVMPLEELRSQAQDGGQYCIRGWIDYDDPNRIILQDFFPY